MRVRYLMSYFNLKKKNRNGTYVDINTVIMILQMISRCNQRYQTSMKTMLVAKRETRLGSNQPGTISAAKSQEIRYLY
jgi:hypothetical protein